MPSKAPREQKELVYLSSSSLNFSLSSCVMNVGSSSIKMHFVDIVQDENKSKKGLADVYEVSMS